MKVRRQSQRSAYVALKMAAASEVADGVVRALQTSFQVLRLPEDQFHARKFCFLYMLVHRHNRHLNTLTMYIICAMCKYFGYSYMYAVHTCFGMPPKCWLERQIATWRQHTVYMCENIRPMLPQLVCKQNYENNIYIYIYKFEIGEALLNGKN